MQLVEGMRVDVDVGLAPVGTSCGGQAYRTLAGDETVFNWTGFAGATI